MKFREIVESVWKHCFMKLVFNVCANTDCWNYGRIKRPELFNGRSFVNKEEQILTKSSKSLIISRKTKGKK